MAATKNTGHGLHEGRFTVIAVAANDDQVAILCQFFNVMPHTIQYKFMIVYQVLIEFLLRKSENDFFLDPKPLGGGFLQLILSCMKTYEVSCRIKEGQQQRKQDSGEFHGIKLNRMNRTRCLQG